MQNRKKTGRFLLWGGVCLLLTGIVSCDFLPQYTEASRAVRNNSYASYDPVKEMGVVFDDFDLPAAETEDGGTQEPDTEEPLPNRPEKEIKSFPMRVTERMALYASAGNSKVLRYAEPGTKVILTPLEDEKWAKVESENGTLLGYARDGFRRAMDDACAQYAELPIVYGMAKTNEETYVEAFSHLVDVRKYFRTYETYESTVSPEILEDTDLVISMKLATNETTIGKPFYNRNLCLLQYDILPNLEKAVKQFKKDGYTVIIYDAYRPTSVQQRWFDVVRVHKWVADPSIGMGGVHDRGTAIDMSLIDRDGKELEMPTPMHTFTEASARSSTEMTETARANMDYMKEVMVGCGFTYINSEWWHFQDVNTKYYLPTDHPIDTIPLVASEESPW